MKALRRRPLRGVLLFAATISMVLIAGLLMLGCNRTGGPLGGEPGHQVGESPAVDKPPIPQDAPEVTIVDLSEEMIGRTITVEGEVTQQCPAVGCWMMVKDSTGEVFVDLKPGGLELKAKHEGEPARVAGRVIKQGGELKLEAEAVEFGSETSDESDPAPH